MNIEYETRPANPGFAGYKSARLNFEKEETSLSESFADLFDFALNLCIVGRGRDVEAVIENAAEEMKAMLNGDKPRDNLKPTKGGSFSPALFFCRFRKIFSSLV